MGTKLQLHMYEAGGSIATRVYASRRGRRPHWPPGAHSDAPSATSTAPCAHRRNRSAPYAVPCCAPWSLAAMVRISTWSCACQRRDKEGLCLHMVATSHPSIRSYTIRSDPSLGHRMEMISGGLTSAWSRSSSESWEILVCRSSSWPI
jgi:hypothetical protein